jgi:hypothetical protein
MTILPSTDNHWDNDDFKRLGRSHLGCGAGGVGNRDGAAEELNGGVRALGRGHGAPISAARPVTANGQHSLVQVACDRDHCSHNGGEEGEGEGKAEAAVMAVPVRARGGVLE